MRALLQDDPPVHDGDAVGMADRGQAVGNDKARAPNLERRMGGAEDKAARRQTVRSLIPSGNMARGFLSPSSQVSGMAKMQTFFIPSPPHRPHTHPHHDAVKRLLHLGLAVSIQGAGGLVQQQDL